MNDDKKLLWMFKEVHGDIDTDSSSCSTEVEYDDEGNPEAIAVMKNGNLCWRRTKLDIIFEYLTKHLD